MSTPDSRRNDRSERPDRDRRMRRFRRRVCAFCADKVARIDYKDVGRLRRSLSERAQILPRRQSGTCARHQRKLALAIKRARFMAMLPFVNK